MKVLQFVCDGAPGGGTNHVVQLLTGIRGGVENVLLTEEGSYLNEKAEEAGIEVHGGQFFNGRLDRSAVNRVKQIVNEVKPDIVHCHGGRAAFFYSLASLGIPMIYTVHGFHYARKNLLPRTVGWAAEFGTIRKASHVLFVSHYDRQLAIRHRLLPRSKSHSVIHNGIKPLTPRDSKEKLGVGFIGRFVYQKHPERFLDVAERMPDHKFVMAGGGELDEQIRTEVEERGLTDHVELVGSLDHKSALEFISKLDVLVMTPRWEGLPLLPLEAMFLKVPVVSTAVGGIPEVIDHGTTGLLSKSGCPDELASHVDLILGDSEYRQQLVDQAYEVAHQNFSQDSMLQKIRGTYTQVFKGSEPQETEPALSEA